MCTDCCPNIQVSVCTIEEAFNSKGKNTILIFTLSNKLFSITHRPSRSLTDHCTLQSFFIPHIRFKSTRQNTGLPLNAIDLPTAGNFQERCSRRVMHNAMRSSPSCLSNLANFLNRLLDHFFRFSNLPAKCLSIDLCSFVGH